MRKVIVAGNWKMNKTAKEAKKFISELKPLVADVKNAGVVIGAPFTALETAVKEAEGSNIKIAAQNMNPNENGAYTGEISPLMLKDLGVEYVILGHSERREYYGETDKFINEKVKSALKHELKPILCIGEKLEERENSTTEKVVKEQLIGGLEGVCEKSVANVVIAYEPVWAIGTGKAATAQDAETVSAFIRKTIEAFSSGGVAERIRILYGGSVTGENISSFLREKDVDGALIGGASLKAEELLSIYKKACE